KTSPTSNRKGNDNAIAYREIFYFGAGLFHDTHKFVAEDEIFYLRKETVVNMQIGTANGGGGDTQDNISRVFDFWIINVVDLDVSRPMKNHRFHLFPARGPRS